MYGASLGVCVSLLLFEAQVVYCHIAALLAATHARRPCHANAHAHVPRLADWGRWCCTAHLDTRWCCTARLFCTASRRMRVDGGFLQRGHPIVASRHKELGKKTRRNNWPRTLSRPPTSMRWTFFASANLASLARALERNSQKVTSSPGSAGCSPTVRYRLSLSTPTNITRLSCCPIGWMSLSTGSSGTSCKPSGTGASNTSVFARATATSPSQSSTATRLPRRNES